MLTVFGREDVLLFITRAPLLSEILAADVLKDGEAECVEQEIPGLMLLLYKTARCQAECVTHSSCQQQNVQLWEWPITTGVLQGRLWKKERKKATRRVNKRKYTSKYYECNCRGSCCRSLSQTSLKSLNSEDILIIDCYLCSYLKNNMPVLSSDRHMLQSSCGSKITQKVQVLVIKL